VFSSGVCVGELERGRFVPHHQLFSAYGDLFVRRLMLSSAEERTSAYLRGLEINAGDVVCSENAKSTGYAVVTVDGVALGGGKISNGVCKNHYPKGLRNQK
jgi:NOL1/NOP2/fmu family ribosome biogenesis protein